MGAFQSKPEPQSEKRTWWWDDKKDQTEPAVPETKSRWLGGKKVDNEPPMTNQPEDGKKWWMWGETTDEPEQKWWWMRGETKYEALEEPKQKKR
ncbi:hypothetical protein Pmani_040025 [Petrolisthes manimaculis]|uniref:Uncharacterized protein n=1 Tax=Petrolisthes manimaculis TaxID=1843537 RepID=A0AAE1NCJ3_9EUCA|nr:hypothetical protein Pmani_040025 [Petrolisthes manimaculis]